jgi:hypothetical protein
MSKFQILKLVSIMLLLCSIQPSANADSDDLQLGIQKYNSGNYTAARVHFLGASMEFPKDAYRAYWLGLTDLKLQNYSEAYQKLESAYSDDVDGPLAKLAQQGVSYALAQSRLNNKPIVAKTNATPNQSVNDVAKALNRVSEQGQIAATSAVKNWNAVAQADQDSATSGVAAIQKRENETIRAMKSARIAVGNDGDTIPAYSPGEIASMAKTFDDEKNNLANAEKQAQANAETLGLSAAKTIKHDVRHLSEQLLGNEEPTGLKLVATGTNLYTRNYAPEAPAKPASVQQPAELKATPEQLVLSPVKVGGKTISRLVKVPTSGPAPDAHLSVTGILAPH